LQKFSFKFGPRSVEDFRLLGRGQDRYQIVVDFTICGDEFTVKIPVRTGEIGALAAGFSDEEFSGGGVIRLNVDLPVTVESAGGDVTHVHSGRARDADAAELGFDGEEMIEVVILGGVAAAAEAGGDEAFCESRAGRDLDIPAIAESSLILFGFKQFGKGGQIDGAEYGLAFFFQSDRYGEKRLSVNKGGGAVDGIDQPAVLAAWVLAGFFTQDGVSGIAFFDLGDKKFFNGLVGFGDQLGGGFSFDGEFR